MDILSSLTRNSGTATIAKALLAASSGTIADGATSPTGVLGEIRWSTSLNSGQGAPVMWDGSYWRKLTISDQPTGTLALFDFGTGSTPLYTGATRVTDSTLYNGTTQLFGWVSTAGMTAVDRSPSTYTIATPPDFYRDACYGPTNATTFRYKLPSGVTSVGIRVHVYDGYQSWPNLTIGATGKTSVSTSGGTGNSPVKVDFASVSPAGGNDYIDVTLTAGSGSYCLVAGIEISSNTSFSL